MADPLDCFIQIIGLSVRIYVQHLRKGSSVIFKVTDRGVFFLPCEITERDTYTQEEWGKIKRLVAERGKTYKTSKGARKYLRSL